MAEAAPAIITTDQSSSSTNVNKKLNMLFCLDDSVELIKTVENLFKTIYFNMFAFTDSKAFFEQLEIISGENVAVSVLISGKFGQMIVHDQLQSIDKVKHIYVFCFDVVKHSAWAQGCSKVRLVSKDFESILQRMQYDIQMEGDNDHERREPVDIFDFDFDTETIVANEKQGILVADDHFFDQLAFDILTRDPHDGELDFEEYYRQKTTGSTTTDRTISTTQIVDRCRLNLSIRSWYMPENDLHEIHSYDLMNLWRLRWLLYLSNKTITAADHQALFHGKSNLILYHVTRCTKDELDRSKVSIGEILICTEFLVTFLECADAQQAEIPRHRADKNVYKNRIIFEIRYDPAVKNVSAFGEIEPGQVLIWFGARLRLARIEFIEDDDDGYWIMGFNLCSGIDISPPKLKFYNQYFDDLYKYHDKHYAIGRLLMYKGLYADAEHWLTSDNAYEDLAELALRQCRFDQVLYYLDLVSNNSHRAQTLRVFLLFLTRNKDLDQEIRTLMRLSLEADDKILRTQIYQTLGFYSLLFKKDPAQALDYFHSSHHVLSSIFSNQHPFVAKILIGIGYVHYALKDIDQALKHFDEAFTIQSSLLPKNHPDFARTFSALAHCSSAMKNKHQALEQLDTALKILHVRFAAEHHNHLEIIATKNDIIRLEKQKELHVRSLLLDYI